MKECDRKTCPCCEVEMKEGETVQVKCYQVHNGAMCLDAFLLTWECKRCGCVWQHGQAIRQEKPQ